MKSSTDSTAHDQVWRMTPIDTQKSNDETIFSKQKQRSQIDANFSIVAGLSSSSPLIAPSAKTSASSSLIDVRTRRDTNTEQRQNT